MPLAGTQQAFLFTMQAYIQAGQLDKLSSVFDLVEERKVFSQLFYDLALHAFSQQKDWDGALDVLRRMEDFGFHPDWNTMMKVQGVHDD